MGGKEGGRGRERWVEGGRERERGPAVASAAPAPDVQQRAEHEALREAVEAPDVEDHLLIFQVPHPHVEHDQRRHYHPRLQEMPQGDRHAGRHLAQPARRHPGRQPAARPGCVPLGVSNFHWFLPAHNPSLNSVGTDCAKVFNFQSFRNVRNAVPGAQAEEPTV